MGAAPDWLPGVDDVGAPQMPALAFCLAMSAMVIFCVGVDVFLMVVPASSELKASPPDEDLGVEVGLPMEGERTPGVLVADDGAGLAASGTEV